MTSRLWTAANVLMLLAFAFSAAVQVNDPDPLSWIGMYLAATLVCAFELRRRAHVAFPALLAAGALGWAATIAPRVLGVVRFTDMFAEFEMRDIGIEESREMYGLLVVAIWMAAVAVAAWRRRGHSLPSAQGAQRA